MREYFVHVKVFVLDSLTLPCSHCPFNVRPNKLIEHVRYYAVIYQLHNKLSEHVHYATHLSYRPFRKLL